MSFTFFFSETSPFSQWYRAKFTVDGETFNCAEQFMMYCKALLFGDVECSRRIMLARHPRDQKSIGRQVRDFDESVWCDSREAIVYEGNHAKFTQNPDLLGILRATRGTTLVEASPYDRVWGIGLDASDPRARDPKQWRGLNLLGKILTQLRDDLEATP